MIMSVSAFKTDVILYLVTFRNITSKARLPELMGKENLNIYNEQTKNLHPRVIIMEKLKTWGG